jgi:RNA polymerase sigma factor (sigma-70 family)
VAASGEEIERVYATRYTPFRRAVSAIVGDEERAHDVVQEAFARALARRKQFRRGGSLEAWIWRIVVREALNVRGRPLVLLKDDLPTELVASESDPELADAIRRLPPRRRLILFLRYFADLPYDAIGELCGISTGTVAAALSQAHDELRKELQLQGVER